MKSALSEKALPSERAHRRSPPQSPRLWIALLALLTAGLALQPLQAQDPFVRDTTADAGIEPNPDPGPMWVSPDIWVRNTPDPNYDPAPYPIASPTWTPQPHENPEYDDPKTGFPAYVYVRVRNRGGTATTGTERLRVYWAKASTGLSWPTQWVDYLDNSCGPTVLHGMEVTKPRRNAALVSAAERTAYIDALLDIDSNVLFRFSDGVQYWDKQNVIHAIGGALHGVPGFLPWHREFLNRLEVLLRESDPLLTLLYWDWTTDPRTGFGVNLFSTSFMGASSGTVSTPITGLRPPTLTRDVGVFGFSPDSDASILGAGVFPTLRVDIESSPNHNSAHGYIGGPSGQMSFLSTAAHDPFFFLLHGNVDRLWAQWQEDPTATTRIDPATAYGTDSTHSTITSNMNPWAGSLTPWSDPVWQALKNPLHPSVVTPPIYDTAPLTIPVLQPGEEVILQVPWFPPNPADFACFGDSGHFCLLARIETSTTPPFGMTFPEGTGVSTNTRNNNNIAWKNVTVVDDFSRLRFFAVEIVRNYFDVPTIVRLTLRVPQEEAPLSFWNHGDVYLTLPTELAGRWTGDGVTVSTENAQGLELAVANEGAYVDIPLQPGESFPVTVAFDVRDETNAQTLKEPFAVDMIQTAVGQAETAQPTVMGGQRFVIDASKLTLVDDGTQWAVHSGAALEGWQAAEFDDSTWTRGRAPFLLRGDSTATTTYFRRTFTVDDPSVFGRTRLRLQADEGAVVYLNGTEIYRRSFPTGPIGADRAATGKTRKLEKLVYWEEPVSLEHLLQEGDNTIAVEVHQAAGGDSDSRFDLSLSANQTIDNIPPTVRIEAPANGSHFVVGDPIDLKAEALDQDGGVNRIDLLVDGQVVASQSGDLATLVLGDLEPGVHRIEARVTDSSGATTRHAVRVTVHSWLPPVLEITEPVKHATVAAGEPIAVKVEILSAPSAPVQQVELFVKEGQFVPTGFDLVTSPNYPAVAMATSAPYELTIPALPPGMHMLQVSATDAAGHVGVSSHVMIMVEGFKVGATPRAQGCTRRDVDGVCMELRLAGDQDGDGVDNRWDFCPDSLPERSAEPDPQGTRLKALGGCACYQIVKALGLTARAGSADCTPAVLERWKTRLHRELRQ